MGKQIVKRGVFEIQIKHKLNVKCEGALFQFNSQSHGLLNGFRFRRLSRRRRQRKDKIFDVHLGIVSIGVGLKLHGEDHLDGQQAVLVCRHCYLVGQRQRPLE